MKLKRELGWLMGAGVAATTFCYFAPEYGYSPVPFFTMVFYLMTGVVRFVIAKIV